MAHKKGCVFLFLCGLILATRCGMLVAFAVLFLPFILADHVLPKNLCTSANHEEAAFPVKFSPGLGDFRTETHEQKDKKENRSKTEVLFANHEAAAFPVKFSPGSGDFRTETHEQKDNKENRSKTEVLFANHKVAAFPVKFSPGFDFRAETHTQKDKKENRRIQHYNSSQKILLVGEGDFSFSACLAKAFGTAVNMVATSLHSREMLPVKHWTSKAHLEELEKLRGLVLHEIDVCNMNQHHILRNMKFDIIVFNFPHAGHFRWLNERNTTLINKHRKLIKAFFKNAREMLKDGGEIHVTHRDDYPYNRWKVAKIARQAGLVLKEKVEFVQANYPGYHNKRGSNINCNKKFPLNQCFTFKFTSSEFLH